MCSSRGTGLTLGWKLKRPCVEAPSHWPRSWRRGGARKVREGEETRRRKRREEEGGKEQSKEKKLQFPPSHHTLKPHPPWHWRQRSWEQQSWSSSQSVRRCSASWSTPPPAPASEGVWVWVCESVRVCEYVCMCSFYYRLTPFSPPMRCSSSTMKRLTFWTFLRCFHLRESTSQFSGVLTITFPCVWGGYIASSWHHMASHDITWWHHMTSHGGITWHHSLLATSAIDCTCSTHTYTCTYSILQS